MLVAYVLFLFQISTPHTVLSYQERTEARIRFDFSPPPHSESTWAHNLMLLPNGSLTSDDLRIVDFDVNGIVMEERKNLRGVRGILRPYNKGKLARLDVTIFDPNTPFKTVQSSLKELKRALQDIPVDILIYVR